MTEKHQYRSNMQWGSMRFDLDKLKGELLSYFHTEAMTVSEYHAEKAIHDLYDFHSKGISIHMQNERADKPTELKFIDVELVSEVTPTVNLENILNNIAEKNRKKEKVLVQSVA